MAATSRERFNWEDAVVQDVELQRIDAYVKLTVSKLSEASPPRADAGRGGSRYEPPPSPTPMVKTEPPMSAEPLHVNQYIDPRDYQSESSSELDTREVNPMDELSDFESDAAVPVPQAMDIDNEDDDEDKTRTVCEVCKTSDHENEIILCDECDAEFHLQCLEPPLAHVPEGNWFCPNCRGQDPPPPPPVHVKTEAPSTPSDETRQPEPRPAADERGTSTLGQDTPEPPGTIDATSIPIAHSLAGDPEKSNLLLIHACNCDEVQCTHPTYHVLCAHMKRFLRSVCWASHSEKWRSYRLAWITAELFAYHALHCTQGHCNVPLCERIREEEIV